MLRSYLYYSSAFGETPTVCRKSTLSDLKRVLILRKKIHNVYHCGYRSYIVNCVFDPNIYNSIYLIIC
jgi:hypothetical protein